MALLRPRFLRLATYCKWWQHLPEKSLITEYNDARHCAFSDSPRTVHPFCDTLTSASELTYVFYTVTRDTSL